MWSLDSPLASRELRWLARGGTPLADLFDLWVGSVTGDRWMRLLPVVLGAGSAAVAAGVMAAGGLLRAAPAAVALAALPILVAGSRRVGPDAVHAALAALALAAGTAGGTTPRWILLAAAIAAALLDPILALAPLGALCGWEIARLGLGGVLSFGCVAVLAFSIADLAGVVSFTGAAAGGVGLHFQRAALLLGALAALLGIARANDDRESHPSAGLAMGMAFVAVTGLLLTSLRRNPDAPLTVLFVAVAVAAVAGRARVAAVWVARAMALSAALGWLTAAPWQKPQGPRLREAAGDLALAGSEIHQVLPGVGLSPGAVAHVVRPLGLDVVREPTDPVSGRLSLVSSRPPARERREVTARLGDRVLRSYGVRSAKGSSVMWSLDRTTKIDLEPGAPRPNIAIVSVDTLRADHLSFYGYERETSPRLRRWAATAWTYDRAIAAYPSTAPSFAALFTGRMPSHHGVRSNYQALDPGNWTLARILAGAGYHTAAFVSSFVLNADNSGFDLGFELYDSRLETAETNRRERPIRLAPSLAQAVGDWAAHRAEDPRPWFVWVHAIDPHGPYTPLAPFRDAFRDPRKRSVGRKRIPGYQWLGTTNFFRYVDAYDAEILQTDFHLGEIIERLEGLPAAQGTIVIFVADHGEEFGEHGHFFEHDRSLHGELVNVPLVIKDPALPGAGRKSEVVSLLDIAPTLLERLGIRTDLPLDGVPLSRRTGDPAPVLSQWKTLQVAAVKPPWKVILTRGNPEPPKAVFYDVESDPGETRALEPPEDRRAALVDAARPLLEADPLLRAGAESAEREQWKSLPERDREKLRSLGYVGD